MRPYALDLAYGAASLGRPIVEIRKKLAKLQCWGVQSMAEALKPEHGLENVSDLKSWAAFAVYASWD